MGRVHISSMTVMFIYWVHVHTPTHPIIVVAQLSSWHFNKYRIHILIKYEHHKNQLVNIRWHHHNCLKWQKASFRKKCIWDHLSSVRRVYDKFWKICIFYQKRANRNQDTVACNHTSVLKVFEIKPRLVHVDLIKSHLSHSGLILTFARLPKLINSYHMLIVEKPKCYFWLPVLCFDVKSPRPWLID